MAIQNSRILLAEKEFDIESSSYPVDMSAFLVLPQCAFDAAAVPYQVKPAGYHPTTIAQYALAHWNQYLTTAHAKHRGAFLAQANWLVEHEVHIGNSASGWPISFPHPEFSTRSSWLSAPAQGCGISVLVRAYQLTQEKAFLEAASRAIRTFEQDILDGGISTPVGKDGIFFEEVAVYPAAHVLSGFIFALFGLYDYVALTGDIQVKKLMQRSLAALHSLLDEFDVGYWTRSDLLHRRLASFPDLTLQVTLLEALARYSGCQHCALLASGWRGGHARLPLRSLDLGRRGLAALGPLIERLLLDQV